ncbi:unnamed protein product [Penicillium egyptiacum]|uniref:Zn(2)-C6 fungal-type domain-containing protein n=1 Tax=Penicillium egyptiacum TaxID=1303716 RepID=A0A9W4KA23_9EURO|nr:unnamed protein product [Penicillium egyptiacum]
MSPLKDHMQMHDSNQNQNQNQTSSNRSQPRPKFRASCDPCAASKVRCTKEQNGCSRCVRNGLKCVYGRSRRKGKPPSSKNSCAQTHHRHSQLSSPIPPFPGAPASPPGVPAPSSSWAAGQHPGHHRPNYNFNCPWYRSPMFPTASYQNQTLDTAMAMERERRTPNSLTPHQSLPDDNTASHMPVDSGYILWPNLSGADRIVTDSGEVGTLPRKAVPEDHGHSDYDDMGDDGEERDHDERHEEVEELEDANKDQHEPCITVACRVLSSLYQFVRCDCGNGHASNSGGASTSRDQCKPLTPEEAAPTGHIVFRMTQSATEMVSRLLDCTGSACAQDASMLLVLGAILSKILTWYQALYQSEIGSLLPSAPSLAQPSANPPRPALKSYHSNSSRTGDQVKLSPQVDGTGDSMYAVPLTIPLSIVTFNICRATETKMKAQLLLCQLQNLHQVCQGLDRRVQAAESMRGEKNLWDGSNAQLLEKVCELQRALTVVCTQAPPK